MADQYTPEEIQDIFERYNDAIRRGIPISDDLARAMNDLTKGAKTFTNQLNSSISQLGTSFKTLAKDINDGSRGASGFNNSLEKGAEIGRAHV